MSNSWLLPLSLGNNHYKGMTSEINSWSIGEQWGNWLCYRYRYIYAMNICFWHEWRTSVQRDIISACHILFFFLKQALFCSNYWSSRSPRDPVIWSNKSFPTNSSKAKSSQSCAAGFFCLFVCISLGVLFCFSYCKQTANLEENCYHIVYNQQK